MEIALGLGVFLAAAVAFDLMLASYRKRHGGPASPSEAEGTARRLSGLLATWTGRSARVQPYTLRLMDPATLSEAESGLRFAVDGLCASVTLWRNGFADRTRVPVAEARPIGEPEMDRLLLAAGPPADVLALLTATTRAALRDLFRGTVRLGQVWLEGGTLTVDVPTGGFAREHPGLEPATRAIAGLAAKLQAPSDPVERLAENVTRDPAPGVRLGSLRALVATYGQHPGARAAVISALRDADPFVRLEAAIEAKAQGRETLVRLAVDPAIDETCAVRAIQSLGPQHLPLDRVEPLVQESTYVLVPGDRKRRPAVTDAFFAALAAVPGEAALAVLTRIAAGVPDAHGPVLAQLIAARPAPEVERILVAALESLWLERPLTATAAAKHLERLGSVDAVPPLRETASRYRGSVASAARSAIAAIQERAKGSRGRLALTDDEAGRLSEATDPSGRVTLPDEDA